MVHAWEQVIEPYFEAIQYDDQEASDAVDDYLAYVEDNYIGKLNTRNGIRKKPRFAHEMWSLHSRIVEGIRTTNNSVESWNARWNKTIGDNRNALRVITGFKKEDSLARTKLQEYVAGRNGDPNSGRTGRRSYRSEELRISLSRYNRNYIKEFLYGFLSLNNL